MYENIDMKKTGLLLKTAIGNAGYTVKPESVNLVSK